VLSFVGANNELKMLADLPFACNQHAIRAAFLLLSLQRKLRTEQFTFQRTDHFCFLSVQRKQRTDYFCFLTVQRKLCVTNWTIYFSANWPFLLFVSATQAANWLLLLFDSATQVMNWLFMSCRNTFVIFYKKWQACRRTTEPSPTHLKFIFFAAAKF